MHRTKQQYTVVFKNAGLLYGPTNKGSIRPKTKMDNETLKVLVEASHSQTTREFGSQLGKSVMIPDVSRSLIREKKLEIWVPNEWIKAQQLALLETCSSLLLHNGNEPFLVRLATWDEKWVFYDNSRRSRLWLENNEKPQHMTKSNLHPKKIMIPVWWRMTGSKFH